MFYFKIKSIKSVFKFIENKVVETLEDKIIDYENNIRILCFGYRYNLFLYWTEFEF